MAKVCDFCGKGYLKGNLVPRGVGRRVTRRTSVRKMPNLHMKRVLMDGNRVRVKLCSSCLRQVKQALVPVAV